MFLNNFHRPLENAYPFYELYQPARYSSCSNHCTEANYETYHHKPCIKLNWSPTTYQPSGKTFQSQRLFGKQNIQSTQTTTATQRLQLQRPRPKPVKTLRLEDDTTCVAHYPSLAVHALIKWFHHRTVRDTSPTTADKYFPRPRGQVHGTLRQEAENFKLLNPISWFWYGGLFWGNWGKTKHFRI